MSWWIALLSALPLPFFASLHLRGYLKRRVDPERREERPALLYGQTSPSFILGTAPESYQESSLQTGLRITRSLTNSTVVSDSYEGSVALARPFLFLLLTPPRLILWAWAARTWRPLALLAAFVLTPISIIAWFSQVGASAEASRHALAFAWDAGFAAAVEVPLLIVLGAWPWWRWRGLVAGLVSAAILVSWLLYVLPAPA
jgi:hypothetical protein